MRPSSPISGNSPPRVTFRSTCPRNLPFTTPCRPSTRSSPGTRAGRWSSRWTADPRTALRKAPERRPASEQPTTPLIMAGVPDQIKGLDDPTMIDMVMLSPEEDRIDLIMVHTGVWDRSTGLLLRLEEKWQHYVGFAIHGGLAKMYPDYAHLPWRIVLDCRVEPDDRPKWLLL